MQPESERSEIPGMEPAQPEIIPTIPEMPRPRPNIWGPWASIGLGAVVFFIYSAIQNIVAIVFGIILFVDSYSRYSGFDIQEFTSKLTTDGLMLSVAVILGGIAGLGFIFLFIKIRHGASLKEYLELNPISLKSISIVLGVALLLLGVTIGISSLLPVSEETDIMTEAYKNTPWPAIFWIATVIFAPLFEESLFRGFLFTSLKRSVIGPVGTIILTALVFAALHGLQYPLSGVATVFVLGLVLGLVRWKTGSLWGSIILHGAWNLLQMIMMTLAINGVI